MLYNMLQTIIFTHHSVHKIVQNDFKYFSLMLNIFFNYLHYFINVLIY